MKEHELNLDTIKERTSELEKRIEKIEGLLNDKDALARLVFEATRDYGSKSDTSGFLL